MFVDTEPRSATLHQRLDHQPTLGCSDALSFLLMQTSYFQLLACSSTQRPRSISFSFNHFRTLFIATEGVPHLPIPHTRRRCTSLSPLDATPMDVSASVANKRLNVLAKPFRCNTYKNVRGPFSVQVTRGITPGGGCVRRGSGRAGGRCQQSANHPQFDRAWAGLAVVPEAGCG